MKKKSIVLAATALMMAAALVVGGTLAYFTDTDDATNTFTVGNVDIELIEKFDPDNALLIPGKANAINKDVSIKNVGTNDAYVWYTYKIPAALDSTDGSTGTNNILHVNSLGRTWDTYRENSKYWAEGQTEALPLEQTWDHDANVELNSLIGPEGFIGTETIDGVVYNVYVVLYHGVLAYNQETTQAMDQAYLDSKVDYDHENDCYTIGGKEIDFDFEKNPINIIVTAYAIQADGFDDVYEAYTAYQGQVNA